MYQRAHMKVLLSHLGRSLVHFPAKLRFQTSSSFMRNSVMGAVFLITRSSPTLSVFLLLFFCFPLSLGLGVSSGIGFFGRWLDKIGGKSHIEGAVLFRLQNFVKTNEAIINHRAVGMFLTLAQPTLGAYFHVVQELCGKLAVGSYAHFEDYFLGLDGSGDEFCSNDKGTARTK
jgi:hypothetical protein